MKNEPTAAAVLGQQTDTGISADQVAAFLRRHPEFFSSHEDLLVDLHLPHESGRAISLLEKQISLLRSRGADARSKLNNLLDNARTNDLLFETTRDLVLALLQARDANEIISITQDRLSHLENVDACEVILAPQAGLKLADNVRTQAVEQLKADYKDIFRLRRTHCGSLSRERIRHLFPAGSKVKSTAICPIMHHSQVLGLLALGNHKDNYFNLNLDTLFLDFIGNVVGAVLGNHGTGS